MKLKRRSRNGFIAFPQVVDRYYNQGGGFILEAINLRLVFGKDRNNLSQKFSTAAIDTYFARVDSCDFYQDIHA